MSVWRGVVYSILTAFFALAVSGCASTVEIDSDPQGASVEIDGEHIGETPVEYTDTATILGERRVVIEMDGYETVRTELQRDGDVNNEALIVGIVGIVVWPVLPAWLWVLEYPEYVEYDLVEEVEAAMPIQRMAIDRRHMVKRDGDTVTFYLVPEGELVE